MNELKIGIVVADDDEYKPLEKTIEEGSFERYSFLSRKAHKFEVLNGGKKATVISILCGIGKVNATAAAMHLVDIGCDIILNFGLSGGISNVSRGEISLPNEFVEHDFDLTGLGYKLCEKPGQEYIYSASEELLKIASLVIPAAKVGVAVSGDHFICDPETRDNLKQNFSAMSCDMETAAIAYVAAASGKKFLSVRRISDDAGENAVDTYREMNVEDNTLLSDYILRIIKEII